MNFKYSKTIALFLLIAQAPLHAHETQEQEILRSNTQQQMIANFFNIVIQGLLLVSAEKKEDQIQAATNAINSISNITQLSIRSVQLSNEELLEYATEHHEEMLVYLQTIINSVPHTEHAQID